MKIVENNKEVTYKIGDVFKFSHYTDEKCYYFLLVQVGINLINFIDLSDGNRVFEALSVENSPSITKEDMIKLTKHSDYKLENKVECTLTIN